MRRPDGCALSRTGAPVVALAAGLAGRGLLCPEGRHCDQPAGNVEILRRFWTFDGETAGQVPDLLVYADLLAIGDARCLETAKEMHDGIVARFE